MALSPHLLVGGDDGSTSAKPLTLIGDALKVTAGGTAGETYPAGSSTVTVSGNTTVLTPTSGKAVRLYYICLSARTVNSDGVDVAVKFVGGSDLYKVSLLPGAIWARNIGAGRFYIQGGVDVALQLNLSAGQAILASFEYEFV